MSVSLEVELPGVGVERDRGETLGFVSLCAFKSEEEVAVRVMVLESERGRGGGQKTVEGESHVLIDGESEFEEVAILLCKEGVVEELREEVLLRKEDVGNDVDGMIVLEVGWV